MEENITSSELKENIRGGRYSYIVGIDFGTYSTSFSFAHVDYENDIQTITEWEIVDNNSIPGRVASSVLYRKEDSVPLWGNSAKKKFYNEKDDFFYTPHIKLYLTDADNQPVLPGSLTSVKLASDYLKQLHEYGVNQMKAYFKKRNEKNEEESFYVPNYGISLNKPIFNVTVDQIRYIVSYPDNQVNGVYKAQIREALKMAGIVSFEDPEHRLRFIPASEATARFCSNTPNYPLKPSKKPYLVCDIGGEGFGLSTIKAEELPETGTVKAHIDQAVVGCGNLDIDKNMREYLKQKITASPEDIDSLEVARCRLFDFFVENIKLNFSNDDSNTSDYVYKRKDINFNGFTIQSNCLRDSFFIFPYEDVKRYIFDPVTDTILECIEKAIDSFENEISGIFLSGVIGDDNYLVDLITKKIDNEDLLVYPIRNCAFAVSEGLIYSGIRERGLMIPYFISKDQRQKQKVLPIGNEQSTPTSSGFSGIKKINHKDIDYIIGLDFGTTYSGFAYSPVPRNEEEEKRSHTLLIKEIKAWPKQANGNCPKVPSMLYYSQQMEYLNKFGHEAKAESTKIRANGVLLRHFKLLLSREFNPTVDDKILKKLDGFDIVDAIANFLKDFNKEGIARMKRTGLKVDENRLVYVVTIPAMWSDEAKNTMKAAVKKAVLVKHKKNESDLDQRLVFITEAEAAALYCERYYKEEFRMEQQQRFMICDAGGIETELTTFEVSQEESTDGKLLISELTSGAMGACGSIHLDDNFKSYISSKFNNTSSPFTEKGIDSIIDEFIRDKKPNFEPSLDPDMEEEIRFNIPMSLGLPTDLHDDTGFLQENEIIVSYSDMENIVFKPVVDQVLDLIDKQLRKLPEGERQLDSILVVGGFGQSLYLHQKIKERFENKAVGAVFIGRPPNGDLAVCRGAVSFALDPRMVSEGITRYTYGLQTKDIYKSSDDPLQKMKGYDGQMYCQNVFSEIVAKETKINKGAVYVLKTFIIYPNDPIFAVYSVDDKDNSKDLRKVINSGDIQPICKLTAKMPEILEIKEGDKVEFEIMVEITGSSINVGVLYQGKLLTEKVVTKANMVISKKKYELGSRAEKKKKRWGVQIFSMSGSSK